MITFNAPIERFGKMFEKTGWFYVPIAKPLAESLNPGCRKSFRVKGIIDGVPVSGIALMPMGEGNFIMALAAPLRKILKKGEGNVVSLSIELHSDFTIDMPEDLTVCLSDEPHLLARFNEMPQSHRSYFIRWIDSAKGIDTRVRRIAQTVSAMSKKQSYGEMIRENRNK